MNEMRVHISGCSRDHYALQAMCSFPAANRRVRVIAAGTLLVGLLAGVLGLVVVGGSSQRPSGTSGQDSDACGPAIRKPDGSRWTCTFHEDFDGEVLGGRWRPLTTRTSGVRTAGQVCFVSTPHSIAVRDGRLLLTAGRHAPFSCPSPQGVFRTTFTSAAVSTETAFHQAYGRFSARIRFALDGAPGVHGAFWLFPHDPQYGIWPHSGEIDIAEGLSIDATRVFPSVHYRPLDPRLPRTGRSCPITDPDAFHEYTVEWTPASMVFSYDGRACFRHVWQPSPPLSAPQPFDQPFFIALSQIVGNGRNAPVPGTRLPASLEVEWVRVWE